MAKVDTFFDIIQSTATNHIKFKRQSSLKITLNLKSIKWHLFGTENIPKNKQTKKAPQLFPKSLGTNVSFT